jgi:CBS domain-containing protein
VRVSVQVLKMPFNQGGRCALKTFKVRDLTVPLSEYATVGEDATLFEAVMALEKAQEEFDHTRYRHRAVLVLDKYGKVVGKISQLDALRALEPKYRDLLQRNGLTRLGFTTKFMKSILKDFQMFASPLHDICKKAGSENVKTFMYNPTEGEYVSEEASLDEAIHQLIIGHHQSLLVTHKDNPEKIVGVLRLTDVFAAVFHAMKECYL